jgi:hypothetical protein
MARYRAAARRLGNTDLEDRIMSHHRLGVKICCYVNRRTQDVTVAAGRVFLYVHY